MKQIENDEVEEAITTFIAGLDHGCVKCAFGVIHTVMNHCSYTMTDDEAISIFSSSYSDIKLLAEEGDTEAMVMVAEGIRYGFVDDDEESYLFWLTRAAELGDKGAMAVMEELGMRYDPWELPNGLSVVSDEDRGDMDLVDTLLLDDRFYLEDVERINEDEDVLEESALIDDADWVLFEQFGVNYHLQKKKRIYELLKCRDDFPGEILYEGD